MGHSDAILATFLREPGRLRNYIWRLKPTWLTAPPINKNAPSPMSPPIKLSHFYLQVLALGLIITGAWARDPGPSHPTPSPKWLPKRDSIPLANATGAIAAFDRYCPWCWGNLKIPDDPSNMTCHCNIVVQRPVDASRPLSEYIDVAVLSHDFKELRGMQLRVPWDVPTNIAVVLVEPYKNGTVQVTVVSPTGPGGGNGTGTGTETDGMNGA